MDAEQIEQWNRRRETLFAGLRIPDHITAEITAKAAKLDYPRALAALTAYRDERPYKGFYWDRYLKHYGSTATDGALVRATAPRNEPMVPNGESVESLRHRYSLLPEDFLGNCRTWFDGWGYAEGTAMWFILCLDCYEGKPVDQYQQHPWFGSRTWEREQHIKEQAEWRKEVGYLHLIGVLRSRLKALGGNIDVVA